MCNVARTPWRYLQNACNYWSKQGKLNATLIKSLSSHINSSNNKAAWLLLSLMATASVKIDHAIVLDKWKQYTSQKGW
ncbi:Condensin-2 complex subunit D3 [Exaiptasia diaphana]|nr:Condensin-2 complex subunit D3 [Exaiptasia diaphana]